MGVWQRLTKAVILMGLTVVVAIAPFGCGQFTPEAPPDEAVLTLPDVEAIAPPELPDWIEEVSPIGKAEGLAQIGVRFSEPVIPLSSLDDPDRQNALAKFHLDPPLPGQFRFLTPRMVGFQPEKALPQAARVNIVLERGLADLSGHALSTDLAWTIETEPFELELEEDGDVLGLEPTLTLKSSTPLAIDSLRDRLSLHQQERPNERIGLSITATREEKDASQSFDPSRQAWRYQIKPQSSLAKSEKYVLDLDTGVQPQYGNMHSDRAYAFEFSTYSPLEFQTLDTNDILWTAYHQGSVATKAELVLNNPIDLDSAKAHIHLSPEAKTSEIDFVVKNYRFPNRVTLNPWLFEADTAYSITLDAELEDIYGQTLGKSISVDYKTGDYLPLLSLPTGFHIFPAGQNLQLHIESTNLPDDALRAIYLDIYPEDVLDTFRQGQAIDGYHLLPASRHRQNALEEWPTYAIADAQRNRTSDTVISVKDYLKQPTGMMAYGVAARTHADVNSGKWLGPRQFGLIQLTNIGLFAQVFPDSGIVRAHHIADGSAIANASVELYASPVPETNPATLAPCFVGETDATGAIALSESDMATCLGTRAFDYEDDTELSLLVLIRDGDDWAFASIERYSGSYGYGIYADWDRGQPRTRGAILSDRGLYQPGETIWLTGEAFYLQNDELKSDRGTEYTLTLRDPKGTQTPLGKQQVNDFGSFSLEHKLLDNQPLGYYSVEAKGASGVVLYGGFRVAEFKPPNFNVSLDLERSRAAAGDAVAATTTSSYLFGAPVQDGKVKYAITRRRAYVSMPGWEDFAFGPQWSWPEEAPELPSDVLQTEAVLDANGTNELTFAIADDLPYPMTYRIDAEVSDVSNLSVADSQTLTAFPGDRLIGLQTDFVAEADRSFPVRFVVTDPEGRAIAQQKVHFKLQKRTYSSVTRLIEGAAVERPQVQYETVAEVTARSGASVQIADLTPPESGSYRIEARLAGSQSDPAVTHESIWVSGPESTYWGNRYAQPRLDIQLDKQTYQPGDTATALIQSPYAEGELYFAVVRRDRLYETIIPVKGGTPQVQFEVTPDMLPNAAVQAVLVRQGDPLSQVDVAEISELSHIGFAPFQVDLADKYLDVAIAPETDSVLPGGQQTLSVQVNHADGGGTRAQVTLAVVNEAVLQLNGYRFPDLIDTVYAQQPISTRFADNRPNVALSPPPPLEEKGWGYGGGLSAGAASTRIRKDFRPLAYFNGSVVTDADGRAEVAFSLPDDLTTWRVLAIASTPDLRFGSADATFISTQPLLTNPVLPQFARLGDAFDVGIAVTNTSDETGSLNIQAEVERDPTDVRRDVPPLLLVTDDRQVESQTRETQVESGTKAYRFQAVAAQVGRSLVRFRTQLGTLADGFEVPLEVKALAPSEQTIATGATEDRVSIPLRVDEAVMPNSGGLQVTLASTLLPDIVAPVREIVGSDDPPFLEPAATQLAIAAHLQTLRQTYARSFPEFDPAQQAATALKHLRDLQHSSGGFRAWPGSDLPSIWGSTYAAHSIAAARTAGFAVDEIAIARLASYLNATLANPEKYERCYTANDAKDSCKVSRRLETLLALAALGDRRSDFLDSIYTQRKRLDTASQFRLARYLSQFPQWQDAAAGFAQDLQEIVTDTGRSAAVNVPREWGWMRSPTVLQAEALKLAVARDNDPDAIARSVRGLLDIRREGIWPGGSYNNAIALDALLDYAARQPEPPDFETSVQLGQDTIGSAQFQGYNNPSLDLDIPMSDLPEGDRDLVIQTSGSGELHYLAAYQYRLPGPQPGRFAGLRVTRTVRPAGSDEILQRVDLSPADRPLALSAGRVFDIQVEITTDRPVDRVIITEPLPAGLEAVDTSFHTSARQQERSDSWAIDYQSRHRDRVVAYADRLGAGVYKFHYLVRSVTPGTFVWPGSTVRLQYEPETFGRSSTGFIRING